MYISENQDTCANAIKEAIKAQIHSDIIVKGEWVTAVPEQPSPKFFVRLYGVDGLPGEVVTNSNGISIDEICNVDEAVTAIITNIARQGLINLSIFKDQS